MKGAWLMSKSTTKTNTKNQLKVIIRIRYPISQNKKASPQKRSRNKKICDQAYNSYQQKGGKYSFNEILEGK